MLRSQLRLELLKLTYTHARSAEEAVSRASELEKYAFVKEDAPEEVKGLNVKNSTPKKIDNAKNSY